MPKKDISGPQDRFKQQRWRALARGIEWQLEFEEWLQIWIDSGHFAERGKKAGQYVMARRGDVGPYSKDNVYICTFEQNIADAHANNPAAWPGFANLGKGRGWTLLNRGRLRYQVLIGSRYVGSFATQSEAEAAYQRAVSEVRVSHGLHLCPAKPLNTTQLIRGPL